MWPVSITIMGSAPVSMDIPNAERTYFASAAAHQIENRMDCWGEICCVFPIGVAETGSPEPELSIFLTHTPYDRLVLRKSLWSLANQFDIQTYVDLGKDVTVMTYYSMVRLWAMNVGLTSLVVSWLKGAKFSDYMNLFLNPYSEKVSWLENFCSAVLSTSRTKVSTGVLSLLLAIEESEPDQQIHIFGITLARDKYSYDTSPRQLADNVAGHMGHMKADKQILIKVYRRHFARLHFDDPELVAFLKHKL